MPEWTAERIAEAWIDLETAMRSALPACSVAPPTQPSELLAALRINRRIGPEEEDQIRTLRNERNRIAHAEEEPTVGQVQAFVEAASRLKEYLRRDEPSCDPPPG